MHSATGMAPVNKGLGLAASLEQAVAYYPGRPVVFKPDYGYHYSNVPILAHRSLSSHDGVERPIHEGEGNSNSDPPMKATVQISGPLDPPTTSAHGDQQCTDNGIYEAASTSGTMGPTPARPPSKHKKPAIAGWSPTATIEGLVSFIGRHLLLGVLTQ